MRAEAIALCFGALDPDEARRGFFAGRARARCTFGIEASVAASGPGAGRGQKEDVDRKRKAGARERERESRAPKETRAERGEWPRARLVPAPRSPRAARLLCTRCV